MFDFLHTHGEGFLVDPGGCAGHGSKPCSRKPEDVDIPGTRLGTRIVLDRHVVEDDVELARNCISKVRDQSTVLIGRSFSPEAISAANCEPKVTLIRHDGGSLTGGANRDGSEKLREADLS